jgi:predicted transcriptional regulator
MRLKFPADIVHEGLIADMGAKRWSTYCVITSFMNEYNECYPTQEQIAERLGVSRQSVSRYITDLVNYRWNDRPLVRAIKGRDENGRFTNTFYKGVDLEWVIS